MALFSGTAPVLAQPSADEGHPLLPQLNELVAGLLLLGGVTVAAAVWMAVIRRGSRRQLQAIQRREAGLDEHYRDLFENAHDILFTHDHEGRILSLNRAGEELLGYPRQEACQLKFTQFRATS